MTASAFPIKNGLNREELFTKEFSGNANTSTTFDLDLPVGIYHIGITLACVSVAGGTGTVSVKLYVDHDRTALTPSSCAIMAHGSGKLASLITAGSQNYAGVLLSAFSGETVDYGYIIAAPFGLQVIVDKGTVTSGTYSGIIFAQKVG